MVNSQTLVSKIISLSKINSYNLTILFKNLDTKPRTKIVTAKYFTDVYIT